MNYPVIKEIRKSKKITLGKMAEQTGIHRVRLTRIENGSKTTRVDDLEKICGVLGLELRVLIQ